MNGSISKPNLDGGLFQNKQIFLCALSEDDQASQAESSLWKNQWTVKLTQQGATVVDSVQGTQNTLVVLKQAEREDSYSLLKLVSQVVKQQRITKDMCGK